jgi:hypothetical protein
MTGSQVAPVPQPDFLETSSNAGMEFLLRQQDITISGVFERVA